MNNIIHRFSADPKKTFLWVLSFVLVSIIVVGPPANPDMWWHLSNGRAITENREIITNDIFSYTRAGEPWINAFWLADLLFYLLYGVGGFYLLSFFVTFMAVVTMIVIFQRGQATVTIKVLILLLATLTVAPSWSLRPQLFSFLFVAILDRYLSSDGIKFGASFWIMILLFSLWSNLHGGFIFGFLLLIAYVASRWIALLQKSPGMKSEYLTRLLASFAFMGIAAFAVGLNPNGLAIWKLPFETINSSLWISEWQSPNFHKLMMHPMLWLLFLLISGLGLSTRKISLYNLFKILGFAYLAFYSQRGLTLFVIVTAPIVASYLEDIYNNWEKSGLMKSYENLLSSRVNLKLPDRVAKLINLTIVSILFAVSIILGYLFAQPSWVYRSYPKEAVNWVEAYRPEGQMLSSYNWGGYLIWDLPGYPVFIDGRADLYGSEIISDWWRIVNASDRAEQLLDIWEIDLILLEKNWPLIPDLIEKDWMVLFEDDKSILIRRPT